VWEEREEFGVVFGIRILEGRAPGVGKVSRACVRPGRSIV
jgi:hypothetical protein